MGCVCHHPRSLVCLDGEPPGAIPFDLWTGPEATEPWQAEPADDVVMLVGTGGTTGRPKGVILTGHNIETMSALTLLSYPFGPRPRYLALAPFTHVAGVLCFPVMTLGGQIVIMPKPDLTEFLALIERHQITHTFLPPTLIYMLLDHPGLASADLTSLRCRVMAGYYKNPAASAEATRHGWHHTGDIGYLDEDSYLFIVDRAKDMIITGGFNVYSAEVEQVLLAHPAVQDCAVIGLPDEKWGERVTAVLQLRPGHEVTADDVRAFVKDRLGSVKAPKQVEVWPDLPRSKVGKILKPEIRSRLHASEGG